MMNESKYCFYSGVSQLEEFPPMCLKLLYLLFYLFIYLAKETQQLTAAKLIIFTDIVLGKKMFFLLKNV